MATINVVKSVDDQPDGAFDDPANGWTFQVADSGGVVEEQVTGADGLLSFTVPSGETYAVQETAGPAGLRLANASCVDDDTGDPLGMAAVDAEFESSGMVGVSGLALETGQSVTCTFENERDEAVQPAPRSRASAFRALRWTARRGGMAPRGALAAREETREARG